jgi:hypothetical protein
MFIFFSIGDKKWHRIFGWCTVTHPQTPDGHVLVNSQYKHLEQYQAGKGWIEYKGTGKDGHIASIFMKSSELFDEEQTDKIQSLVRVMVKIIE